MIRTNIYLTQKQIDFLKSVKKDLGINASESIRQLVNKKMEEVGYGRKERSETKVRTNTEPG